MQDVLKSVTDDRVRAYIVWVPMLATDTEQAAQERSREFADDRLSYFWDRNFLSGERWKEVLSIERKAWDVYFLFGADAQWEKDVPMPDFWMHQLWGVTKGPRLNREEFTQKLKDMLSNTK